MENGHHPFEQMISFKGPIEKLKIKWTVLLLPQQGITTSKSHWADSRGKLKTEVSQAEPYRWPHRISTGWKCLVVLPLFFKVPSIQKESISWIPVAIMEIKASSKVLMLTGIHMQRALLLLLPQEGLKNSSGWFLYLESRWVGVYLMKWTNKIKYQGNIETEATQ